MQSETGNAIVRRVKANGIEHAVREWLPDVAATAPPAKETIVLVHGWMDVGASWELVAPHLVRAGYRVIAPDMRGFGDTERAPVGSYYHFADYVADLSALVDQLVPDRFVLVGHSMGGTLTSLYASARPSRVRRLVLLEGTGPGDNTWETGAARLSAWLDELAATGESREPRLAAMHRHVPAPYETMLRRLARSHSNVDVELLRDRLPRLVVRAPGVDADADAYIWNADPRHKMTSPTPFFSSLYQAYAARITAPTMFVDGGPSGYKPEGDAERRAAFRQYTEHVLDGAGHMMHWTRPSELAALILAHAAS